MNETETLRARVRELEALLRTAIEENRALEMQMAVATAHLGKLRTYLRPEVAAEAIRNAGGGVVPAYKVDECTSLAVTALGGAS